MPDNESDIHRKALMVQLERQLRDLEANLQRSKESLADWETPNRIRARLAMSSMMAETIHAVTSSQVVTEFNEHRLSILMDMYHRMEQAHKQGHWEDVCRTAIELEQASQETRTEAEKQFEAWTCTNQQLLCRIAQLRETLDTAAPHLTDPSALSAWSTQLYCLEEELHARTPPCSQSRMEEIRLALNMIESELSFHSPE